MILTYLCICVRRNCNNSKLFVSILDAIGWIVTLSKDKSKKQPQGPTSGRLTFKCKTEWKKKELETTKMEDKM